MEDFPHEVYSEETPPRESVPIQVRLQRLGGITRSGAAADAFDLSFHGCVHPLLRGPVSF